MCRNKCWLGLCPRPHLQCSPRPPSWIITYRPFGSTPHHRWLRFLVFKCWHVWRKASLIRPMFWCFQWLSLVFALEWENIIDEYWRDMLNDDILLWFCCQKSTTASPFRRVKIRRTSDDVRPLLTLSCLHLDWMLLLLVRLKMDPSKQHCQSVNHSWGLRPRSYNKTGLRPASVLVLVLQFWSWSYTFGLASNTVVPDKTW